ncbi:BON domain-containing protein [Mangrovimicrobium sediminis]|uniref:BON domain-containing protein n=1 Tax=Mangrovimicrobium sediminis TaxID=2562682 RepID=A0A4Z0M906_9GAMM|nr:BON domain-containing protein [Haliea sp. SAOS-164]TGD76193.1 BON domain-containing protein [Haliea sp. SAOS-164]
MKSTNFLKATTCSIILAGSLASVPALAGSNHDKAQTETQGEELKADAHNAWMEGKLETTFMLNRHLNNFTIDPEVEGGNVILLGSVENEVDRDLAEEIAYSVDGVEDVDNRLEVIPAEDDADASEEPGFADRVEDATLTAEVKLKLLANSNTDGLDINVDTEDGVVTLNGDVESDSRRDLAAQIAANVEGVKDVVNKLQVQS